MHRSAAKGLNRINKSLINKLGLYSRAQWAELYQIAQSQTSEVSEAIALINAIEKHDWNYRVGETSSGSGLFNVLLKFRSSLKEIAEKEEQHTWITNGIVQFADLLKKNPDNTQPLCDAIISNLVKYLGASQGAVFLYREKTEMLEGISFYAYNRKKFLAREIHPEEGLVGQCFQEGNMIYLTEVPPHYVTITSGLGEALPRSIILVPIKLSDQKLGVIELASFSFFLPYQKEFLKKLSENLAAVLTNVKSVERTARLLKQEEEMTRELRDKEEQLLQNIEELQSIQEDMRRQNNELEAARRTIEEKNREMEVMQRREMELIESKLKAQDEIHQTIIKKLQAKLRELQLRQSQFISN